MEHKENKKTVNPSVSSAKADLKEKIAKLQYSLTGANRKIGRLLQTIADKTAENTRLTTANEHLLQQQRELQSAYDQVLHDGFTIRDERDSLKQENATLRQRLVVCNPDYIDWLLNHRTLWQRIRNVH